MLPELLGYVSSGMTEDGYFASPTPNAANSQSFLGFVGDTSFSVDRGFYDTAFDVEITCNTEGSEIRYTLDGSTPTDSTGTVYSTPITVSGTTTLRAAAFKNGYEPSNTDTQTYIFIDDVVNQSSNPGGAWPTSSINGQVFDYGMDPDIVGGYNTTQQVKDALTSISTISLVTDMDNLFDSSTGIYVNPQQDGYEWERPTSMELIHPDDTSGPGFIDSVYEDFQINAGLRIRGGSSRNTSNPKHSFRVFFRGEYGDSKLGSRCSATREPTITTRLTSARPRTSRGTAVLATGLTTRHGFTIRSLATPPPRWASPIHADGSITCTSTVNTGDSTRPRNAPRLTTANRISAETTRTTTR